MYAGFSHPGLRDATPAATSSSCWCRRRSCTRCRPISRWRRRARTSSISAPSCAPCSPRCRSSRWSHDVRRRRRDRHRARGAEERRCATGCAGHRAACRARSAADFVARSRRSGRDQPQAIRAGLQAASRRCPTNRPRSPPGRRAGEPICCGVPRAARRQAGRLRRLARRRAVLPALIPAAGRRRHADLLRRVHRLPLHLRRQARQRQPGGDAAPRRLRAGEAVLLYYGAGSLRARERLLDPVGLEAIEAVRAARRARWSWRPPPTRSASSCSRSASAMRCAGVVSLEDIAPPRRRRTSTGRTTMPPLPDAKRDIGGVQGGGARAIQDRTMKPFGAAVGKLLRSRDNPRGAPDLVDRARRARRARRSAPRW